jgi:aspartate dehydrogenase
MIMDKKTLGIIGCGNIGSALAEAASRDMSEYISDILLWDIDGAKLARLEKKLARAKKVSDIEEIMRKAHIIVEAVSPDVAKKVLERAVSSGKDVLLMSIGGVLNQESLFAAAREKGIKVVLPSGAISGIDALKAAKIGGLESVTITTRKPPESLKGTPYLEDQGIDVSLIGNETVLFEGNAEDAIKAFPKNINVSALLSIAGMGPRKTIVRIISSPEYTKNIHEIEIRGKFGKIFTRTENIPSPENPKTSYLAVLSAIAALREYFDTVRIGT